jgi:hypothetical protein
MHYLGMAPVRQVLQRFPLAGIQPAVRFINKSCISVDETLHSYIQIRNKIGIIFHRVICGIARIKGVFIKWSMRNQSFTISTNAPYFLGSQGESETGSILHTEPRRFSKLSAEVTAQICAVSVSGLPLQPQKENTALDFLILFH